MEETFEKFVQFCEEYLHNAVRKFLEHVRKRYEECDDVYRESNEFLDNILYTKGKISGDSLRFFAHLREFYNVLKENKKGLGNGNNSCRETGRSKSKRRIHSEDENDTENAPKRRKTDRYRHTDSRVNLQDNLCEHSVQNSLTSNKIACPEVTVSVETVLEKTCSCSNYEKNKIAESGHETNESGTLTFQCTTYFDHSNKGNTDEKEIQEAKTELSMNSLESCTFDKNPHCDSESVETQIDEHSNNEYDVRTLNNDSLSLRFTKKVQKSNPRAEDIAIEQNKSNDKSEGERRVNETVNVNRDNNRKVKNSDLSVVSRINNSEGDKKNTFENSSKLDEKLLGAAKKNEFRDNSVQNKKTLVQRTQKNTCSLKRYEGSIKSQSLPKTPQSSRGSSTCMSKKSTKGVKGKKTACASKVKIIIETDSESESDFINTQDYKRKFEDKVKFKSRKQRYIKEENTTEDEHDIDEFDGTCVFKNSTQTDKKISCKSASNKRRNMTSYGIGLQDMDKIQVVLSHIDNTPKVKNEARKVSKEKRDTSKFGQTNKRKVNREERVTSSGFHGEIEKNDKYEKRIGKTKAVYKDILNKIQKMEQTDKELAGKDRIYHFVHKYLLQRKHMKVRNELYMLHKASGGTRRSAEKLLNDHGTRDPDVSGIIKYFRKRNTSPVATDIRDLFVRVNQEQRLELSAEEVDNLSREVFADVTNDLEMNRWLQIDFSTQSDKTTATNKYASSSYDKNCNDASGKKRPKAETGNKTTNTQKLRGIYPTAKSQATAENDRDSSNDPEEDFYDDESSTGLSGSEGSTNASDKYALCSGHHNTPKNGRARKNLRDEYQEYTRSRKCKFANTNVEDDDNLEHEVLRVKQEESAQDVTKFRYLSEQGLQSSSARDNRVIILSENDEDNQVKYDAYIDDGDDNVKYNSARGKLQRERREKSKLHGKRNARMKFKWKRNSGQLDMTTSSPDAESDSQSDCSSEEEKEPSVSHINAKLKTGNKFSTFRKRTLGQNSSERTDLDYGVCRHDRKRDIRPAKVKARQEISKQKEDLYEWDSSNSDSDTSN